MGHTFFISVSVVIVVVSPFKLHGFWHHIFAYFVVDISLVGLAELVATPHAVHLAVLDKMRARLVEAERNVF